MPLAQDLILELVVRQKLSHEEWLRCLEMLHKHVKPWLHKSTLNSFSNVAFLRGEHFQGNCVEYLNCSSECEIESVNKARAIQGIFGVGKKSSISDTGYQHPTEKWWINNGTHHLWCLDRFGKWQQIEVSVLGSSGYKGRGAELVSAIKRKPVSLAELFSNLDCGFEPSAIWHTIVAQVKLWEENRLRQWREIKVLADDLDNADRLVRQSF